MSDELRLPDDLAACEARLAAQALPGTGIDRDRLLYRAGWAACEARLASLNPPPSKVDEGLWRRGARGGIALWSAASAAIAASLAVVLTLQWQPITDRDIAVKPADVRPAISEQATSRSALESPSTEFKYASLSKISRPQFPAGLLSLRRQTLSDAWSQATNVASTNGERSTPPAKTARELMNEYVPAEPGRSTRIWLWGAAPKGDSI